MIEKIMSQTPPARLIIIATLLNITLVVVVILLSLKVVKLQADLQNSTAEPEAIVKVVKRDLYQPLDFTVDFFGMKYRGNSANSIDENVMYFGAYEKDVLFFMRDAMQSTGTPDSIFVDVGASNGQHSLFMSQYAKVVHAFEPYERVLGPFRAMIALNKLENIIIHPVALGEKEEKITFYEPPDSNLGTGTFVESYLDDKTRGKALQVAPGDAALRDVEIEKINIIKIDVEGFEKPVLKGLHNTLETARPFVVLEISIDPEIDTFFKSMQELRDALPHNYGFVSFVKEIQNRITGNYQFVTFINDFSKKEQYNLVAYPEEKVTHIR